MRLASFFLLATAVALQAAEPDKAAPANEPAKEAPKDASAEKQAAPVTSKHSVTIGGQVVSYTSTTGKLQLKQDDGKPRAAIFHVSYERTDKADPSKRPVLFAFNGGPGAASVWLHLGMLGPKRISFPGDGTTAPVPPAGYIDNPESILDACDLVFIDPVSTGYSRPEKDVKAGDFHGVDEDIDSVGDFIRRWVTEHHRWDSPKYLLGESYGGIRAAGLARHLQSSYGMTLNGVVLLSSLLDFATLSPAESNDLPYVLYLPAYTSVAHYHGKLKGDHDALVAESRAFAYGEYASALLQGSDLPGPARDKIAEHVSRLTGIDAATILRCDLRLDPSRFRAELLRAEGKVIGRFDARVAWDAGDADSQSADSDPSLSLAFGAFSTAMMQYLDGDLGYHEDQPYEVLSNKLGGWRWNANNGYVDLGGRLASALRDNPHLRVLVMSGANDLATPADAIAHSVRHLQGVPASARKNISFARYQGGHMFYLNPPDLKKARKDLLAFLKQPAN
jgi:carboxypeptidase C (cathepsin A)